MLKPVSAVSSVVKSYVTQQTDGHESANENDVASNANRCTPVSNTTEIASLSVSAFPNDGNTGCCIFKLFPQSFY